MALTELDQYDLVSLGPDASGWRAIANGAAYPVVAWGVFHLTKRSEADGSVVADFGKVVAGVVAQNHPGGPVGGFVCAAELLGFGGYLSPQMPDPGGGPGSLAGVPG